MKTHLVILAAIMLLIIGCGKDKEREVDKASLILNDYRLFQKTPAWELAKAVRDNDYEKIKEITGNDTSLINYREQKYEQTLLYLTIMNNQLNTFKVLLSLGAKVNVYDSNEGASPIIRACYVSSNRDININEFIKILLKHGANPNDVELGDKRREKNIRSSALIIAAECGDTVLLKTLLNAGADINYINGNGMSALGRAVWEKKYDNILYLLNNGADYRRPVYIFMPDNKPAYIKDELKSMLADLNSEEYKTKMKIVDFLKKRGIVYKRNPVPHDMVKEMKFCYPDNWHEYMWKY